APDGAAPPPPDGAEVFRREGGLWLLRYAGREVRVADSKGLHDLAVLHAPADTGEAIDATARAAYRRRLVELGAEADEADAAGDGERSARIAVERDALVAQLSAAYGLGGRVRRTGSAAERARTAVTARIRTAVGRIAEVHPELARHLSTAVRTGTLCEYRPERRPDWRL
ncbi:ATPase, partial [Kitasatospora sp. NPDC059571]